ncbi:hypothetical protein FYZ48_19695 [Gimesia chilikensis]|uniref:RDD family protein n=1 Tax=Gimesia chilikensis TaxID=2605989 RepID=UPI0011F06EAC|nr:RDD family protein [Gimesia chilikensis]KAA0134729.1 hypothetical protein FYZ48_19695 [Gimesia chilikensis]
MNSSDLCQRLRVSESQFRKICQHLKIAAADDIQRTFTPREIQRLQHFVETRRSATGKKNATKIKSGASTRDSTTPPKPTSSEKPRVVAQTASTKPAPAEKPVEATALPVRTSTESESKTPEVVAGLPESETAPVLMRAIAYVIDALLTLILAPLVLIPILGQILIGLMLCCYWLFRDAAGASPGKLLLGLQVSNNSADPARVGPRILRNIPLCIGPFLFCIPIIGFVIGVPVAILVVLTEVIMLLVTGRRIGDLLGDTSIKTVPKVRLVSEP